MSKKRIVDYAFEYFGVMKDAMQSLPIGNGDIGANVWLTDDGKIHFLISKTNAWSELSRLLKLAHIELSILPCPFKGGAQFRLNIADGVLDIFKGNNTLKIYADAFAPCVRVLLNTEQPVDVAIKLNNYRNEAIDPGNDFSNYFMSGSNCGIVESADTITTTKQGGIAQIHRNAQSCYEFSLKNQHMDAYWGRERDPLLGLTFGVGLYSNEMIADGESLIAKKVTQINASFYVESKYANSVTEFVDTLDLLRARYGYATEKGYDTHVQSWRNFWDKSYIFISGDEQAETITRAFLYHRYLTRCADRGNQPIKFNGSLFTADKMQGYSENYDARRWGAPYWFQNTRIPYWYLLYMGDYESMHPFFDMYLNMMPIAKCRCENYFGHDGILIPETVSHFGLYANANYGFANENGVRECNSGRALRRGEPCNGFIRYHYNGMLELSYMMLKYLELSGDISRKGQMLAFIEKTLLFFDRHFDKNNGKLVMNPVSSLETWQMCVNDAPNIAGLKAVCEKLNSMKGLSPSLKAVLDGILPAIPNLPFEESKDGVVLAPCEIKIFEHTNNSENPELYAVFPFELYGLNKDGLDIARRTYNRRASRHKGGWSQDPVDATLLGLEADAVDHLVRQSGMKDTRSLFPAFFGPNFDETPDQDHGGMTSLCLIFMLLQTNGNDYTVFPVWPRKWNVRFRLPLKNGVYVYGEQVDGERVVREERV